MCGLMEAVMKVVGLTTKFKDMDYINGNYFIRLPKFHFYIRSDGRSYEGF